jgi:hypothetical protein
LVTTSNPLCASRLLRFRAHQYARSNISQDDRKIVLISTVKARSHREQLPMVLCKQASELQFCTKIGSKT